MSRPTHQKGDTIVEVLIVVTVLGMVIASGFAIANRSLRGIRAAQERGEALKIAETQIERVKHYSKDDATLFTDGANFCIQSDGSKPNAGNPLCTQTGRYVINTSVDEIASDQFAFQTTVTWDRIGGTGQDTVSLYYKMYRESD